jgi:hypothetical protein
MMRTYSYTESQLEEIVRAHFLQENDDAANVHSVLFEESDDPVQRVRARVYFSVLPKKTDE